MSRSASRSPVRPRRVAEAVARHYHDAGYTFARVSAAFDAPTGALTLTIDEGVIDGVEFEGIDDRIARTFAEDFALRSGDVFNRNRAREALDALLRPTRGAVRPGASGRSARPPPTRTSPIRRRRSGAFDLIERNGQRILLVGLREPSGRFKLLPDLGEREDWFTPVDGFVPSLGFGAAVFDHDHFNHAYVAGHLSFKTASDGVGYALGFERPLFGKTKLYVGGELHDLTASDDQWQISGGEASFAAFGGAAQLSRLLPAARRAGQRRAARPPAGRAADGLARRTARAPGGQERLQPLGRRRSVPAQPVARQQAG